jgi:outer membrane protein assembly factor BamD (BamD/ComL family)
VTSSPGLAIVRLRAHRDHFPTSALGQEVSLRLVQAVTALGRDADARREAQTFVTRYPQSARRAEMEAIAGGAPLARPTE